MTVTASFPQDDVVSLWQERKSTFLQAAYANTERHKSDPFSSSHHFDSVRRRTYRTGRRVRSRESIRLGLKRAFDLAAASSALLFFAPLFLAIAAAVKWTSPGPVLFSQPRYGYRNRRFHIYKFRTMYAHLGDRSGTQQAMKGDSRVTPIGRFLRNTSLDELPQLINVIRGDMSLVGPRPHVPGMLSAGLLYEDLVPYYFQRHIVRPGITGLAQVHGCRGSTRQADEAIARVDYDLEYIERWSLWLDIKIIWWTIKRELLPGRAD
jgi:exopolysaccharide biosynthesis polyprenyl glycosylphosphotransferase